MYQILSLRWLLFLYGILVTGRALERSPELENGIYGREVSKRDVCVQDDWLIGFKAMYPDSYPFCSSLLGIGTLTGTATGETIGVYVILLAKLSLGYDSSMILGRATLQ